MARLHKNIVTDESGKPLAVQIDYADWLAIEQKLVESIQREVRETNLDRHSGVLSSRVDPLEYQKTIRSEWR